MEFLTSIWTSLATKSGLDKHTFNVLLLNTIFGIIIICMQMFLTFYYIDIVSTGITFLNFILILSYLFFTLFSLKRIIKLHTATQNLKNAENYNGSLTALYDGVRGFKHDFSNIMNVIGGYIKSNDMEGLRKYYSELETDCIKINNIQLLNPNVINNPGIYSLILSEYQKATNLNIKFNFEFFLDFNNLHISIYEFSRILGILLDNAIDAAKECDDKEINLMFRDSAKDKVHIIIVENTYSDKNIDTIEIFNKGISSKANHSGIGLWEVNNIISKHNNVVLHTEKSDKFFKQQLEIYY